MMCLFIHLVERGKFFQVQSGTAEYTWPGFEPRRLGNESTILKDYDLTNRRSWSLGILTL